MFVFSRASPIHGCSFYSSAHLPEEVLWLGSAGFRFSRTRRAVDGGERCSWCRSEASATSFLKYWNSWLHYRCLPTVGLKGDRDLGCVVTALWRPFRHGNLRFHRAGPITRPPHLQSRLYRFVISCLSCRMCNRPRAFAQANLAFRCTQLVGLLGSRWLWCPWCSG